ncbi:MAG TPA: hypothetical protein VLE72_00660 [Candidatus Saccharimonadales bacterium]|nr:hypothetical protein [Candidatus Saccharimonadales bacterium]
MSTATYYAVRRNQNLTKQTTTMRLGPISGTFVVIAAVSILALLYLNQITKTNVFGLHITELQKKSSQLQSNKQDLEVEAARLQSIQEVSKSQVVAQMVPESQVTYTH